MKSESAATNRPALGPVTFGIRKLRRAPFRLQSKKGEQANVKSILWQHDDAKCVLPSLDVRRSRPEKDRSGIVLALTILSNFPISLSLQFTDRLRPRGLEFCGFLKNSSA